MHAIFIRGRNEPIVVDDMIGRELKERWAEDRYDNEEKIELDGVSFQLKTIYRIENKWTPERDRDAERARNTSLYAEDRAAYEEFIRKLRARPIPERARNLSIPRLIWHSATGERQMPPDITDRIIERQDYYFRDHPKAAYAHPLWYRDLIPIKGEHYRSVLRPFSHQLRDHEFRLAERILQASYAVR